jgi:hypothetical protein
VSVANVAQPRVGERRDGAVERLVWHRDQVDRRPQINEFRGGKALQGSIDITVQL